MMSTGQTRPEADGTKSRTNYLFAHAQGHGRRHSRRAHCPDYYHRLVCRRHGRLFPAVEVGRLKLSAALRLVALAKELLHHFVEFVVAERHLYFRWPLFSGTFASNRCVERRPERPVPPSPLGAFLSSRLVSSPS